MGWASSRARIRVPKKATNNEKDIDVRANSDLSDQESNNVAVKEFQNSQVTLEENAFLVLPKSQIAPNFETFTSDGLLREYIISKSGSNGKQPFHFKPARCDGISRAVSSRFSPLLCNLAKSFPYNYDSSLVSPGASISVEPCALRIIAISYCT